MVRITRTDAAAEMLRRRQVRSSLTAWCESNGYQPAKHHKLLISKLEQVARGEIERLAIFMPPGSAKSTFASILFPPWLLAQIPTAQILAASHTSELAERWGRRVRNLISENSSILGLEPNEDNQSAGRWSLKTGGEYMAAGALMGIAGFRALFGIIDDPIRSRQDAESLLVRDRIWDWYLNDFRPRLVPKARQVLIMTRWSPDDLAGRALNHQHWEVVSLPALAKQDDPLGREPGEPLWNDDDYGYGQQLLSLQSTTPPRVWSSLYQQEPSQEDGNFFKEEWLKPVDIMPAHRGLRVYGASDFAVTKDGGDWTVHVVFGVDNLNNLYLLDVWRKQSAADEWVESLCDLVQKYRPLEWAEETGQIRSGVGPYIDKRMRERRLHVNRTAFPTRGDKAVRARSIQGRMALDGLYYPKNAPWAADWISEVLSFPVGKTDDQCDAMGLGGQLLDKMVTGRAGRATTGFRLPDDGYGYGKSKLKTVDAMTL